ncbi:MAG: MBL fold metallo-hydrolase [Planctomycetes bacterium]|nr:MBL fold metallo-hydrolase [Planctomycetota bacterium]
MASRERALDSNVPGDFFVDSSCIDCDTCRWLAPTTFDRAGEHSRVHRQPDDDAERFAAELALVACPTGSIGVRERHDLEAASAAFPLVVEDEVHHLGFHDEASFGAASYLIVRSASGGGNVMVDVPRWNDGLARRIVELGGARRLFLTHVDDVGASARWAKFLGAERVMHERDAVAGVERELEGVEPIELEPELVVVPTPGHTAGSACLLWRSKFLFSGDHVAFSRSRGHVYAFRDACWFDWRVQLESMKRLARFDFEWILPGHGTRCRFTRDEMKEQMRRCIEWM